MPEVRQQAHVMPQAAAPTNKTVWLAYCFTCDSGNAWILVLKIQLKCICQIHVLPCSAYTHPLHGYRPKFAEAWSTNTIFSIQSWQSNRAAKHNTK
jgi:hypothetical protein